MDVKLMMMMMMIDECYIMRVLQVVGSGSG